MPVPVVPAVVPVVVPAVPERVYDRLHTARILIDAGRPNDPIPAIIKLWKGRVDEKTGLWEFPTALPPPEQDQVVIRIEDVMLTAGMRYQVDGKPKLYLAMVALLEAIAELADEFQNPPPGPPDPEPEPEPE